MADVADLAVQAAFWCGLLFVPMISLVWAWWRHPYGRAVMAIDVLLTAALFGSVLQIETGYTSLWLTWLTLAAFMLIPARTIWLAVVIVMAQVRGRERSSVLPADKTGATP